MFRLPIADCRLPLILLAALLLSACGFKPLYATSEEAAPPLAGLRIAEIVAGDLARPVIEREFDRRGALRADSPARYDLYLNISEQAEPLAVQIDDSVTRYNYRLHASYRLVRDADGKEFAGTAGAVASFNVVASQYSTLYAEAAAREKATRGLADEIERDILSKFAAESDADREAAAAASAGRK